MTYLDLRGAERTRTKRYPSSERKSVTAIMHVHGSTLEANHSYQEQLADGERETVTYGNQTRPLGTFAPKDARMNGMGYVVLLYNRLTARDAHY